jgi:peptide/nickel transport system substrate-binding protein
MQTRRRGVVRIVAAVVAAVVLCTLTPQVARSQGSRQIVIAHPGPIYTMDAPVTWFISTHWLTMMLYDCLIWRKPDLSGYAPQLAERWQNVAPDRWRFTIRRGATFHNGEPINAETIKWNIDRTRTRTDFMVRPQWQFVKDVHVVDPYTLDVVTDGPKPYTEYDISYNGCGILPPRYIQQVGEREFARRPVGSGPFRLVEMREGERYVFEAWDGYWGGRPQVDRVIYQVIPDQATQVAALLSGQVDLVPSIPATERQRVQSARNVKVVEAPSGILHDLVARTAMNYGEMTQQYPGYVPTTMDKRIRHAIWFALDRNTLAKVQGVGLPGLTRIPCTFPEVPKKYCGEKAAASAYNPEKSKRLIAEAGYNPAAGKKPVLHFDAPAFSVGNEKEVAEAVKAMLEAVGFEVRLNVLELAAFNSQVANRGRNRELILLPLGGSPSLVPLFYSCEWPRTSYYWACDRTWQGVSKKILSEMDPTTRLKLWDRWWEYFIDHAGTIPLYQVQRLYGMNASINWTPRSDGWVTPRDASLR